MGRRGLQLLVLLACAPAGCGGDDAGSERPVAASPVPTEVPAARTEAQCLDLWNRIEQLGSAGQKTPADYVADLADEGSSRLLMAYVDGRCTLIVPFSAAGTRAYLFEAPGGKGQFSSPATIRLDELTGGRKLRLNAEADADGRLSPIP